MIDWNFSPGRLALFFGIVAVFWFLGGFEFPLPSDDSRYWRRGSTRGWRYSVLVFGAGAVSASFVDHWAGNVERSNVRPAYIVLGVLLMGSGLFWQSVMRASLN